MVLVTASGRLIRWTSLVLQDGIHIRIWYCRYDEGMAL